MYNIFPLFHLSISHNHDTGRAWTLLRHYVCLYVINMSLHLMQNYTGDKDNLGRCEQANHVSIFLLLLYIYGQPLVFEISFTWWLNSMTWLTFWPRNKYVVNFFSLGEIMWSTFSFCFLIRRSTFNLDSLHAQNECKWHIKREYRFEEVE